MNKIREFFKQNKHTEADLRINCEQKKVKEKLCDYNSKNFQLSIEISQFVNIAILSKKKEELKIMKL